MKKEAGRRTVIRVMAVLFVGIMAGTVAASGVSRGEETEMALCYENLENLVKESCPQVEMERRQFEERLGRLEDAREELLESRRALREEASDREKDGDAAGAEHYRWQAEALLDGADSLKEQIRQAGNAAGRMELRRMEDTMLWTAQKRSRLRPAPGQRHKSIYLRKLKIRKCWEAAPLTIHRRLIRNGSPP